MRLSLWGLLSLIRSPLLSPGALLRQLLRAFVNPRPGVRMLSLRLWRVSRLASPFLWSARINTRLRLLWVDPDLCVRKCRASPISWVWDRPSKHICTPLKCSPSVDLLHPPVRRNCSASFSSSNEGRRWFELSPLSASFHLSFFSHGGRCYGLSSTVVAATSSSTRGQPPQKPGTLISSRFHPYATSVLLQGHMEASAGSVTLDSLHNPVWINTSVLSQPSLFRRGSSYYGKQRLKRLLCWSRKWLPSFSKEQ